MAPKIPKAKLDAALRAMAAIGVPKETVIPVLKRLLKLFDYNWEHIEADNFLALADAIFDVAESTEEQKRKAETAIEQEHDNKKLKIEQCHEPVPEMLDNERRKSSHVPLRPEQQKAGMLSPHTDSRGKMIETPFQLPSSGVQIKEPKIEPDDAENIGRAENCSVLLLRGQEPPTFEPPLAVMYPPYISSSRDEDLQDPPRFEDSSKGECSSRRNALETSGAEHTNQQNCTHERCIADDSVQRGRSSTDACGGPVTVSSKDSSIHFEVASSSSRAVKLSFTCSHSSAECPDFRMADIESICKEMENRCLRSFKILEPNFSFMNLLKDFCQCIADMGSESVEAREDSIVHIVPAMNSLSTQALHRMPGFGQAGSSNSSNLLKLDGIASAVADGSTSSFGGMQVIKHQLPIDLMRSPHSVDDITKGEESVKIPIMSGIGNEKFPPLFHYIPRNITFQDAYINLSLARIGDGNCCSDCFDDCLAKPIPCACATETGGEFAYTRDGLVKEVFLDACVSMLQKPHNHPHYYCKVCPIERAKNELSPDPCKGHLSKKFIKECWSKCGCSRQCGNRVVQRGITCNLQVFLTPEGKGWGLRSVEKLPRGAFICEYVGEILTNTELYDRTIKKTGNARHTYPVLLDADWGTEGVLKDEEALCLDATFYGNVARFINHRCFDANVIGIPVEVETPDHHYYHLAFFTTRQIEPFEELTWDYGIDFDDVDHPIKAFKCRCGSEHCQDKKRISRSRSNALVLR